MRRTEEDIEFDNHLIKIDEYLSKMFELKDKLDIKRADIVRLYKIRDLVDDLFQSEMKK